MRITVTCGSCGEDYSVKDELAGQRVKCKHCGEPNRVPSGASVASGGGRSRKGSGKKSGGGNGLLIGLAVGGGAVGLIGVIVAIVVVAQGGGGAPAPQPVAPAVATTTPTAPATTPAPTAPATAHATPPMTTATTTPPATTDATTPAIAATTPPTTTPTAPSTGTTTPATTTPATTSPTTPNATVTTGGGTQFTTVDTSEKLPPMDLPELIQKVEPSVVRINVRTKDGGSTGSGYLVSEDGTVVTNYHVMQGAKEADVQFSDGSTAKVLGLKHSKAKFDIAIIQIDVSDKKRPPIPLADRIPLKGTSSVAFGAPLGLSFTASEGIVSAIRPSKELAEEMGIDVEGTWMQTTCPISPGNSGGPLTDRQGRVIGMNTMQLRIGQNLNFAISVVDVIAALKESPSKVEPLSPDQLKPYEKSIGRKGATDEIGTAKGQRLFAETKEIFLINATRAKTVVLDPTGRIWDKVIARSRVIVERAKIELSFGEPSDDAAVMMVFLELKNSKRGTAGAQELNVKAELICRDVKAKANEPPYCKVWQEEDAVGLISIDALVNGTFPRTADEKLAKFFQQFHSAYQRALKGEVTVKDGEKSAGEKPAGDAKPDGDTEKPAAKKEDENPFAPKSKK